MYLNKLPKALKKIKVTQGLVLPPLMPVFPQHDLTVQETAVHNEEPVSSTGLLILALEHNSHRL